MQEKQTNQHGNTFLSLLAVTFIALKLCGVITWSWWWVLAPLWAPLAFVLCVIVPICLIMAFATGQWPRRNKRRA